MAALLHAGPGSVITGRAVIRHHDIRGPATEFVDKSWYPRRGDAMMWPSSACTGPPGCPGRSRKVGPVRYALLGWLGRALDATADPSGTRRAESNDGLVRLDLRPPPAGTALVEIATPDGTLAAPNYEIEVVGC